MPVKYLAYTKCQIGSNCCYLLTKCWKFFFLYVSVELKDTIVYELGLLPIITRAQDRLLGIAAGRVGSGVRASPQGLVLGQHCLLSHVGSNTAVPSWATVSTEEPPLPVTGDSTLRDCPCLTPALVHLLSDILISVIPQVIDAAQSSLAPRGKSLFLLPLKSEKVHMSWVMIVSLYSYSILETFAIFLFFHI